MNATEKERTEAIAKYCEDNNLTIEAYREMISDGELNTVKIGKQTFIITPGEFWWFHERAKRKRK